MTIQVHRARRKHHGQPGPAHCFGGSTAGRAGQWQIGEKSEGGGEFRAQDWPQGGAGRQPFTGAARRGLGPGALRRWLDGTASRVS